MKFYIYTIYDPELESFDQRLNLGPLDATEMREQYRRAFIKMEDKDKSFMLGKKAILIGTFDDVSGKIEQGNLIEVFHFVKSEIPSQVIEGESQEDKCQENSNISTETKDRN